MAMSASLLMPLEFQARDATYNEVGIVYYEHDTAFKALDKEVAQQGGRSSYAARVKGAHAALRLVSDQLPTFRVCNADPSRYKLFRFKSEKNFRTLTIAKINMWIGGSKTVLSDSEIPLTIQPAESGCFTLRIKTSLEDGEYGFSPDGSYDVFMFGVGDVKQSKEKAQLTN
jgi:hypothetical protein